MEEQFIDVRNNARHYETARSRFLSDTNISQRNKGLLMGFSRDASLGKTLFNRAKKKVSILRLRNYITHLSILIRFIGKDLDTITMEDMERFIEALENNAIRSRSVRAYGQTRTLSGAPLRHSYKRSVKITIKKFYKWLWGKSKVYPELVEWIDTYEVNRPGFSGDLVT